MITENEQSAAELPYKIHFLPFLQINAMENHILYTGFFPRVYFVFLPEEIFTAYPLYPLNEDTNPPLASTRVFKFILPPQSQFNSQLTVLAFAF